MTLLISEDFCTSVAEGLSCLLLFNRDLTRWCSSGYRNTHFMGLLMNMSNSFLKRCSLSSALKVMTDDTIHVSRGGDVGIKVSNLDVNS